ncbi:unnamed protein product, partial [Ixodes pacificus]
LCVSGSYACGEAAVRLRILLRSWHIIPRMLWTTNGGPTMVVSPVPEVRPREDVVANAVAKQMERLQILERRRSSEAVSFCLPVIICEHVDDDDSMCSTSSETVPRLTNNRRFLQVPGVDTAVERRPPN